MLRRYWQAAKLLRPTQFGLARESCPLCRCPVIIRLAASEIGVRCPRCGASAVTQSLVDVLERECPRLGALHVYELSAAGPLVNHLRARCARLAGSGRLAGAAPGTASAGVHCDDVQRLSFGNAEFDLVTCSEVFEHVEDDAAGFAEVHRVLRPGGRLVFTVPLSGQPATVERTALIDGRRVQILPPAYHADRYRGTRVFVYRDYGDDILDRLLDAGFAEARIEAPQRRLFDFARPVVVARKE